MKIKHSRGEYEVQVRDLNHVIGEWDRSSFILTDSNLFRLYGERMPNPDRVIVFPAGETSKSMDRLTHCLSELAQRGAGRKSRLVAFGGGVTGDLGGFIAATYMRGIGYGQVPTSLLAMVDSSVGGKVGVDLPEGKNLAGAFWPPKQVDLVLETLATLPRRELINGAAEVWKYGAIMDEGLLTVLEREPIALEAPHLESTIMRCVDLKRQVVEEDEYETTGRRAILNFGHTVGHAIETVTGYAEWLHGEAISLGMVAEARLGEITGHSRAGTAQRVEYGLSLQGLPTRLQTPLSADALIAVMARDKKATIAGLAFSLLEEIGKCKLITGVPEAAVREALSAL